MLTVLTLIGLVVPILSFLDFLFDQKGNKALRKFLFISWYAVQGDWLILYQSPARAVSEFLNHAIGIKWSRRAIHILLYTTTITLDVTVIPDIIGFTSACWSANEIDCDPASDLLTYSYWAHKIAGQTLPNYIADMVSWIATQTLLFKITTSKPAKAVLMVFLALGIGFLAYVIANTIRHAQSFRLSDILTGVSASLTDYHTLALLMPEWLKKLLFHYCYLSKNRASDPTSSSDETRCFDAPRIILAGEHTYSDYNFVPLLPLIPLAIFAFAVVVGTLIYVSRPLLGRPFTFLLERLESSPRHLLTLIGVGLVGLAAIIKVFA